MKPRQLEIIELNELKNLVRDYVEKIECKHEDCDCKQYIFEAALEAFYGPKVWEYV